jgi:hypothetical protein
MADTANADASSVAPRSSHVEFDAGPAIILLLIGIMLLFAYSNDSNHMPVYLTAVVTLSAAAGFFLFGGYRIQLNNAWLARQCGLVADDLEHIKGDPDRKEGLFLTFTSFWISLYLLFYWYAIRTFAISGDPARETPVSELVVGITCVTIASFGACAARYAAYIRMISVLKAALESASTPPRTLTLLRQGVFRREQLFEPPGSLFVTLGITATFLGLAVGLVSLDLSQFFPPAVEGPAEREARGALALMSLRSFVGCMGLALGMSMLGVVTAMAAQWLRGYGPAETTEQLLDRAVKPPPVKAGSRAGKRRSKPVKPQPAPDAPPLPLAEG